MKMIIHTVHIHANPAKAYESLTTQTGLGGWWTTKVEVEPGGGGVIRFTFHGDFHPHMKQTRLDSKRLVSWECVAGHQNWKDNTFSFALHERGGETLLLFVQEYARELSDEIYRQLQFQLGLLPQQPQAAVRNGNGHALRSADRVNYPRRRTHDGRKVWSRGGYSTTRTSFPI